MKRVNILLKLLIGIFAIFIVGIISENLNNTYAATTSYDINAINESKYPGYKEMLQKVQAQHPKWKIKLYYTGLNWNSVIEGEYGGHLGSPINLIYDTYSGEWVCPICGYVRYDVSKRWFCASKEAIAYMMDPRNSLTDDWIFQFQDLASTVGDREAVKKMVQGTFLGTKESYIDAIMQASVQNNISPFHIVSRLKQEQGADGGGAMNGYVYTTETGEKVVVYNLFNIKVSGNDTQAGLLAGAKYAYEQGWFSVEQSIIGGTQFIKDGYIDVGQSTLYFQKFDVIEQGGLYNHQYMANLTAANTEGNTMYYGYKNNGILDSSFEFIIPLYENMPTSPCPRPLNDDEKYEGNISSEITSFDVAKNESGAEYITGDIVIVEWINGESTVPRTIPKLTLESTDGTVIKELYVTQKFGNNFYFDGYINDLDKTKRYIIKAELTENSNISNNKSMTVNLPNKNFSNSTCYITNNILCLGTYEGGLTHQLYDITLNQTEDGAYYISGNVMLIEWINELSTVPSELPKMTLKSTDGTVNEEMFVKYNSMNDYYFDKFIDGVDTNKKYQIEIKLSEINNVSNSKTNIMKLTDSLLGKFKYKDMLIKDGSISFEYEGNIQNEIQEISLHEISETSNYISGKVKVTENVAGEIITPDIIPTVTLESTDGTIKKTLFTKQASGNIFYFDGYIDGLDRNKEYQIYTEVTEPSNIAANRKTVVKISNRKLGTIGKVDVIIKDNKLKYQYDGNLTNELKKLTLNKTEEGKYYISGEVVAIEWVNEKSTVPIDIPKITLVSTDGNVAMEAFVTPTGTNTYYFDRYIDNIDTTKQYELKIELVTEYNISINKENVIDISKITTELGEYRNYKVVINNKNILFKDNSYVGNINSELKQFNVGIGENNSTYVSGEIVVVEWIDGVSTVPEVAPKMRFKSTDGTIDMEVVVTATGTNTYYFDRYIEGIDTSKEYYFEIESGDSNNVSENRKMNVYFSNTKFDNTVVGKYKGQKIRLKGQEITFEKDTYVGNINSELKQFNVGIGVNNSTYVSGEIVVVEWVDGKSTVPEVAPKMRFKSTDGTVDMEVFVTPTGTNTYYFDRYIEGIDTSKQYYFEIESGDNRNVSENRKMNVYFSNTKFENTVVGKYYDYNIKLLGQKIMFEK